MNGTDFMTNEVLGRTQNACHGNMTGIPATYITELSFKAMAYSEPP